MTHFFSRYDSIKWKVNPPFQRPLSLDWPSDESQVNGRGLPLRKPLGFKHHCSQGVCISHRILGNDLFICIDLIFRVNISTYTIIIHGSYGYSHWCFFIVILIIVGLSCWFPNMLSSIWSETYSFLKGCRSISLGLQLHIPTHEVRGEVWLRLTYSECAPSLKTGLKVIHVSRKPWLLQGPFWNTLYMMFIVLHISQCSTTRHSLCQNCSHRSCHRKTNQCWTGILHCCLVQSYMEVLLAVLVWIFWHQLPTDRFSCQQKLDEGG